MRRWLIVVLISSPVWAATIHVACCSPSALAGAISSANDGDSIALATGSYANLPGITISSEIFLTIEGNQSTLVFNANCGLQVLQKGAFIKDLTILPSFSTVDSTGIVAVNVTKLSMSNVTLAGWGKAVSTTMFNVSTGMTEVQIVGCSFSHNLCGAVEVQDCLQCIHYADSLISVTIGNTRFYNNTGESETCALLTLQASTVFMDSVTFRNNSAADGVNISPTSTGSDSDVLLNNVFSEFNRRGSGSINILTNGGNVLFSNGVVINNDAVSLQAPDSLTVLNSTFTDINDDAIQCAGSGLASIAGCAFRNIVGSGVLHPGGTTRVSNCTFIHTMSGTDAGLQSAVVSASVDVFGSHFESCTSSIAGGALTVIQGTAVINGSTFISCSSAVRGGAILMYLSQGMIANSRFWRCTSAGNGGAVYVTGTVQIVGSSFHACNASANGGTLSVDGTTGVLGAANVTESFFAGNAAKNGGAISVEVHASLNASNVGFTDNIAWQNGGAVRANYLASVDIRNATFHLNNANLGGAIFVAKRVQHATFDSVNFFSNTALGAGGGIAALASMDISKGCIHANSAELGGAIYARNQLSLRSTVVSGNTANDISGGVYCFACSAVLSSVSFSNNAAMSGSALECLYEGSVVVDETTTFTNNLNNDTTPWSLDISQCGSCQHPTSPVIVSLAAECVLLGNTSCGYTCDVGFAPASSTFWCNRTQIVPEVLCEKMACSPYVDRIANGSVVPVLHAPVTGDVISLECDEGSALVGNKTLRCVGPNWVGGPLGSCAPIPCAELPVPAHAVPFNSTDKYHGDSVEIHCLDGYTAFGSSVATCDAGTWTTPVACRGVQCSDLPQLANGDLITSWAPTAHPATGDVASFACHSGYYLSHNNSISCFNGTWSGEMPHCGGLPCAIQLQNPPHGQVFNGTGTQGTAATYVCDDGYYLVGEPARTCVAPAWSGVDPKCEPATCTISSEVVQSTINNCTTAVPHSTVCTFTCIDGTYAPSPLSSANCQQVAENSRLGGFHPSLVACVPCHDGSFIVPGDETCTPCSTTSHTRSAYATSERDCVCESSTYESPPDTGLCVECPQGATCAGDKTMPVAALGYYQVSNLQFAPCFPALACSGSDVCAAGYESFMCGKCADGYYRLNGFCHVCPNDGPWRIIVCVLACLLVAVILVYLIQPTAVDERTPGFVSLTIIVSCIQILASFAHLKVHWPPFTAFSFDITSLLNFNIELASPECVIPMTFYRKIQLQLLVPIFVLGLVFVVFLFAIGISAFRMRRTPKLIWGQAALLAKLCLGAFLFFLTLTYLFVSQAALTIFACQERTTGELTLSASPSDKCYTPEWYRNAIYATLGVVFYVAGIPLLLHAVYLRNRLVYGHDIARKSILSHFLVRKYTSTFWFGEVIVMIRKLSIVLITVFAADNAYQQVVLCAMIMFISLLAALLLRAYLWRPHRWLDVYTHVATLVVLLCGLFSSDPNTHEGEQGGLRVMDIFSVLAILSSAVLAIAVFVSEISQALLVRSLADALNPTNREVAQIGAQPVVGIEWSRDIHGDILVACGSEIHRVDNELREDAKPVATSEGVVHMRTTATAIIVSTPKMIRQYSKAGKYVSSRTLDEAPTCLDVSPHHAIVGHSSGHVTIVELLPMGKTLSSIVDSTGAGSSSSTSSASTKSSASSGTESNTGTQEVIKRRCHEAPISAVTLRDVFFYTASGSEVYQWSLTTKDTLREIKIPGATITCLAECTTMLVCGAENGSLYGFDLKTFAYWKARQHINPISSVHIDDTSILSTSREQVVLHSLEQGEYLQSLPVQVESGAVTAATMRGDVAVWGHANGSLVVHRIKEMWSVPRCVEYIWDKFPRLSRVKKEIRSKEKALAKSLESESADEDYQDELRLLGDELQLHEVAWSDIDTSANKAHLLTTTLTREAERRFLSPGAKKAPALAPQSSPSVVVVPSRATAKSPIKSPKKAEPESSAAGPSSGYERNYSGQYSGHQAVTEYSEVELDDIHPASKRDLESSGGLDASLGAYSDNSSMLDQSGQPPFTRTQGASAVDGSDPVEGAGSEMRNPLEEDDESHHSAQDEPLLGRAGSSSGFSGGGLRQRHAAGTGNNSPKNPPTDPPEGSSLENSQAAVEGAALQHDKSTSSIESVSRDRRARSEGTEGGTGRRRGRRF